MRVFKIYATLIFLGILPFIVLCVLNFSTVEEEVTFCTSPRYCRYNYCDDSMCLEYKTVTRRKSLTLFESIKEQPIIIIFLLTAAVTYVLLIIAFKKNSYSYIGYEDLGLLGIISMGVYLANAVLLCVVPMFLFKQIGHGPLLVMLIMALVPFIARPIVVDW